jgi:hypothetical protein
MVVSARAVMLVNRCVSVHVLKADIKEKREGKESLKY